MRTTLVIMTVICLAGCGVSRFKKQKEFNSQDEAGSVSASIISVGHWSEYVDALSPDFSLNWAQAYDRAAPRTRSLLEQIITYTNAKLSVKEQVGDGEGGDDDDSDEKPLSDFDPTTRIEDLPNADSRKADEGKNFLDYESLKKEPFLQYHAAVALKQEVEILRRHLKDVVVDADARPYVVRMQITVVPMARHEPYDVHCRIGFFAEGEEEVPSSSISAMENMRPLPLTAKTANKIRVLPLLVTDALETTAANQTIDAITQLAFAGSFLGGTTAFGLDASYFQEHLQSVVGRQMNSLLTVGRLSDSSINVRIGALAGVVSEYEMVPKNYFITMLVMVPEENDAESISAIGHSEFRHAMSGEALPTRSRHAFHRELNEIACEFDVRPSRETRGLLIDLFRLAHARNEEEFVTKANDLLESGAKNGKKGEDDADDEETRKENPYWRMLWLRLLALNDGDEYFATHSQLPRVAKFSLRGSKRLGLDNGSVLGVELDGGGFTHVEDARLTANLTNGMGPVAFPARTVTPTRSGTRLSLQFPSLDSVSEFLDPTLSVELFDGEGKSLGSALLVRRTVAGAKASKASDVSITLVDSNLPEGRQDATFMVDFRDDEKPKPFTVGVKGATIVGAVPADAVDDSKYQTTGTFDVVKDCRLVVTLQGLTVGETVEVTFSRKGSAIRDPLPIQVGPQPEPPTQPNPGPPTKPGGKE